MRCGSHSRRPSPHGYCSEHATRYPSALELATESVSSHLAWACRALFSYLVLDFSLEDASIRCFADSPIHFNTVFNRPLSRSVEQDSYDGWSQNECGFHRLFGVICRRETRPRVANLR